MTKQTNQKDKIILLVIISFILLGAFYFIRTFNIEDICTAKAKSDPTVISFLSQNKLPLVEPNEEEKKQGMNQANLFIRLEDECIKSTKSFFLF